MAERLSAMQQEILSRSSLSELVQKPSLDLYKRDRQRKPMEDVIEEMRKNIRIVILDLPSAQTRNRAGLRLPDLLRLSRPLQGAGGGAGTGDQVHRAEHHRAAEPGQPDHQRF